MHDPIARDLAALGYLVIRCAPGQIFRLVAFPHGATEKIAPSWIAVYEPTSGFTEVEARVVARDRSGFLLDERTKAS